MERIGTDMPRLHLTSFEGRQAPIEGMRDPRAGWHRLGFRSVFATHPTGKVLIGMTRPMIGRRTPVRGLFRSTGETETSGKAFEVEVRLVTARGYSDRLAGFLEGEKGWS